MPDRRMRSVMPSRFSMVPRNDVPRSAFDLSHTHKTTFDAGELVPVLVHEVLPGDSLRVKMTALARLATPVVPIMDNLHLETFFFFCPNRLVWDNWERFMGEQATPADSTQFLVPQCTIPAPTIGSPTGFLADYFGVYHAQQGLADPLSVNALPFRMYNLIFNDFFRDEDLDTPLAVPMGDGPDTPAGTGYSVQSRRKRHDYFTSARPWPQKPSHQGDTGSMGGLGPFVPGGAYTFPDAGAPVTGIGYSVTVADIGGGPIAMTGNRDSVVGARGITPGTPLVTEIAPGDYPNIRVLINDIRTANQIQLLMERNARGGSRYAEILRSHFGVMPQDARLNRPEYLGGGHSMISINPVAQTSATRTGDANETGVLGELAAVGAGVADRHGFSQSFTEHGFVIGLVNIRGDLTYQQGVERQWMRRGRYDYYWPALAHLGEQAIFTREIYATGGATDDDVFGYQERWAEYRNKPNRVSGSFRSQIQAPLDVWHLAQEFSAAPVLNTVFITENPPVERVAQIDTLEGQEFLFDSVFDMRMVRPLPMFSVPGMGPRL